MVKITRSNRITIPPEIMKLKNWEVGMELIFIPINQEADTELTANTPIIIREVLERKFKKGVKKK